MDEQIASSLDQLIAVLSTGAVAPNYKKVRWEMGRQAFESAIISMLSFVRNGYSPRGKRTLDIRGLPGVGQLLSRSPDLCRIFVVHEAALGFSDGVDEDTRTQIVRYVRDNYSPPMKTSGSHKPRPD